MTRNTFSAEDHTLLDAISDATPAMVLTGAGISVATGIPSYRDTAGTWLRSAPITHQEFIKDPRQRQRYWGRSLLGWPAVRDARPAAAHLILAQLERQGFITHIVTQNVDRLHQRAGSCKVTDLHGRLDRVVCQRCQNIFSRDLLQLELQRGNPHISHASAKAGPDGDADLADALIDSIVTPVCKDCGGTLMPDVVFFGGSIPKERVLEGQNALQQARSLIVIGSSLQVYSGYRFCKWARASGKVIFLLNPGQTRADDIAIKWSIDADAGLRALLAHSTDRASRTAKKEAI